MTRSSYATRSSPESFWEPSAAGRLYGHGLGLSIGFALPDRGSIRASTTAPLAPQFVLLTNRVQRAEILATVGVELLPGLSIGGGLAIGAELEGAIELETTLFPEDVGGDADILIQTRTFPVLGARLELNELVTVGLAFRGETRLPLTQPATAVISLTPESQISADLLLLVSQTYFFSPNQIAAGVAIEPHRAWTVSADVVWSDWSDIGDPGLVGDLLVGGELGALLEVPTFRESEPVEFQDVFVPRVGLEYRPSSTPLGLAAVRGGYFYERTPVPPATGTRNLLDNDKHVVSLGLGFRFRDPFGILLEDACLDVHAQYFRYATRTVRKEDPADPVGDLRFGGDRWLVGGILTFFF